MTIDHGDVLFIDGERFRVSYRDLRRDVDGVWQPTGDRWVHGPIDVNGDPLPGCGDRLISETYLNGDAA